MTGGIGVRPAPPWGRGAPGGRGMGRRSRPRDAAGRRWRRALAAVVLGACILTGSPAPAGAQGSDGGAAPWERITLVLRPDPEGRGMAVLFLARWRGGAEGGHAAGGSGGGPTAGTGSGTSSRPSAPPTAPGPRILPAIAGGQPAEPLPEGLRWEDGRLVDPAPSRREGARDYAYVLLADPEGTPGHLELVLPAPVERLVVLTVADQLEVRGEGMRPAGTVAGDVVGLPGMDLAAFAAGPLPAGGYRLTLAPPGAAAPGGGGPPGLRPAPGPGRQVAPWALGFGAVLLAAGGVAAVRWMRSPGRWERRRRALIQAIVELDRAHAQGEIPTGAYEAERRRLVAAAVVATRRWWAASGRGAADRSAAAGGGPRADRWTEVRRPAEGRASAAAHGAGGGRSAGGPTAVLDRRDDARGDAREVTPG